MAVFIITLVLHFILKLRFPRTKSITDIIRRRYGEQVLTLFRDCEKLDFKIKKTEEDIHFLTACTENNLTPKFVNFKLYSTRFRCTSSYRNFQKKLLEDELKVKLAQKRNLSSKFSLYCSDLQSKLSWIDFNHLYNFIITNNSKKITSVKETHSRKLFKLGLQTATEELDPQKLIFNFSSKRLSADEINALANGLKFGLPPKKINYHKFFLSFEKLFYELKNNDISPIHPEGINRVRTSLKNLAYSTFYSFKPYSLNPDKNLISTLQNLSKDKNIVIMKPDKGNGIVIFNKFDYTKKMEEIISDSTKFKIINEDWFRVILRQEDKVNRFLAKLLKEGHIDQAVHDHLRLSSSAPGVMYGLPKIHKDNVPFRPILSSIGTAGYKISKFLLPFLTLLTTNEYTVQDSFSFQRIFL